MEEKVKNAAVTAEDSAETEQMKNPESIQDVDLIKDGKRASLLRSFKNWSWNLVWKNGYGGKFFVIFMIMFGIGLIMGIFDSVLTALSGLKDSDLSLNIFGEIAEIVLGVGLIGFSFNIAKGLAQKVDNFFSEIKWDRIWKYFVGSLLYGLAVVGGTILLIIPGIIFAIRFKFFMYAIIDKGLGPIDAMKYSWEITKGHFWEIFEFDLYFIGINILGVLCLVIGLIRTAAMTSVSNARYYLLLSNMYDKKLQLGDKSVM